MKREDNATYLDKDGIERFRQPVHSYGRVMGYIRSRTRVSQDIRGGDVVTEKNKNIKIHSNGFNVGKMSEWVDRKFFTLGHTCPRNFDKIYSMIQDNQDFILKYS